MNPPGRPRTDRCGASEDWGARPRSTGPGRPRANPNRSRGPGLGRRRHASSPSGWPRWSRAGAGGRICRSTRVVGARHSGRLLGNLLLTRGFLVEPELKYALTLQATTGEPIGEILVGLGLISERDLVELLAEQLRLEVVDLHRAECDRSVAFRLPELVARRMRRAAVAPGRRTHRRRHGGSDRRRRGRRAHRAARRVAAPVPRAALRNRGRDRPALPLTHLRLEGAVPVHRAEVAGVVDIGGSEILLGCGAVDAEV